MKFSLPTSRLQSIGCLLFMVIAAAAISSAQTFTPLFTFDSTDGAGPVGILAQGTDGNFYGATMEGGTGKGGADGTAFKINPSGKLATIYNFCNIRNCPDGISPFWGLTLGADGNYYGTTSNGGTNIVGGTLYKLTSAGKFSILYSFCGSSDGVCSDGSTPEGGVIQGLDGNFYGTTRDGGNGPLCVTNGYCGNVFKVTRTGTETSFYNFCSQPNCADGVLPTTPLALGTDGNFYGTTSGGAGNPDPTIFKLSSAGKLTTIYTFDTPGANPSGLIQASDGNFYGTTTRGGANGLGSVFKITPGGTFTTLHSFCSASSCTDGADPAGGVVQGSDGNLYGTSGEGGQNGSGTFGGTIFQLTLAGGFTTLYNFCAQSGCTDGSDPGAPPMQGTDGNFYGLAGTGDGSPPGKGEVYKLSVGLGPFVKVQPTLGKVGSNVIILGNNLTAATSVNFNSTAATNFTIVSATEITATVPTGATTGRVTVVSPTRTLRSNSAFHVVP